MDVKRTIRERINPKICDPTYLFTSSNRSVFDYLITCLPKSRLLNVLDLGCGFKPYKLYLEKHGFNLNYVGVDFSSQDAQPDIILDLNKERLPFEDNFFDLVILSEVLEHLFNPFFTLEESIRVLKNGGFLYISTPFIFGNHGIPFDYYRYTDLFYKRYFEERGLEMVCIRKAGSVLSSPIFIANLFLGGLFRGRRRIFVAPLIILNNLIGKIIEDILNNLSERFEFFKKGKEYLYLGVALIVKK